MREFKHKLTPSEARQIAFSVASRKWSHSGSIKIGDYNDFSDEAEAFATIFDNVMRAFEPYVSSESDGN